MCLIVFAWKVIPGIPLIAAANRDEFYNRPTDKATWWKDHPHIYAGRDLQAGGTWLGITRDGRFAALTNVRMPDQKHSHAPTRGRLVSDYLIGSFTPAQYIAHIRADADRYNGFNLLVGNRDTMLWFSNKAEQTDPRNGQALDDGVYGLSNGLLDTPWPKVTRAKAQFSSLLCQGAPKETFFDMLYDNTRANDCRLPHTGVSLELERLLSPIFISSPDYGTRACSVVHLPIAGEPVLHEHVIDPSTINQTPPVTDIQKKTSPCQRKSRRDA